MRSRMQEMLSTGWKQSGWVSDAYFTAINQRITMPNQARWGWGQMFPVNSTTLAAPALGGYTVTGQTVSTPTQSNSTLLTQAFRTEFVSGGTTDDAAGTGSQSQCAVISTTARVGGFLFYSRFAALTNTTGNRAFVGVSSTIPVIESADLRTSTTAYAVGIGYDSGDSSSGTWTFCANNATNTGSVSLTGMSRSSTNIFEFWLWNWPGSQDIGYWCYDLTADSEVVAVSSYTTATNVPNNQIMYPQTMLSTGTSASAVTIDILRWGIMFPIGG